MHRILYIHDQNQDADIDFWRIVVPKNEQIKTQVVQELTLCIHYSVHPGIQQYGIARVKRSFLLERNGRGTSSQFVENCPVCQTEKL